MSLTATQKTVLVALSKGAELQQTILQPFAYFLPGPAQPYASVNLRTVRSLLTQGLIEWSGLFTDHGVTVKKALLTPKGQLALAKLNPKDLPQN